VDFKIRRASRDDIDRIGEITLTAWNSVTLHHLLEKKYGASGDKKWNQKKRDSVVNFSRNSIEQVIVAEVDSQVVGYASWRLDKLNKTGHIGNNAVHPDFRENGIGTALIRKVIDILKNEGAKILRVSTLKLDAPARHIYEKVGFEELARTVHYAVKVDE